MWLDGVPGENAGFGGSRPLPALATAVDAIAPAQVGQTATADNAVATTGNPGGTIMTSQTQSNSSSAGLIIDAVYDSSISMANLGTTLYDQVTGAITAAIDFYEAKISDPITLTIDFGVGNLGSGVLGESTTQPFNIAYSVVPRCLECP